MQHRTEVVFKVTMFFSSFEVVKREGGEGGGGGRGGGGRGGGLSVRVERKCNPIDLSNESRP